MRASIEEESEAMREGSGSGEIGRRLLQKANDGKRKRKEKKGRCAGQLNLKRPGRGPILSIFLPQPRMTIIDSYSQKKKAGGPVRAARQ